MVNTNNKVKCLECGQLLGQVTDSHLKLHGMTLSEYKLIHPGVVIRPPVKFKLNRGRSRAIRIGT